MRHQNWVIIIAKEIQERRNHEFIWGESDCCLTIADIVLAYTGFDMAAEYRGKYKTAIGAARALKRYGKGDIASTAASIYPEISPAEAGRGDLAVVTTEAGDSLGLVFNTRVWAMTTSGLVDLPRTLIKRAWRI